jgi:hypothetical protein
MSGHSSLRRPDTDHLFDVLAHGYRRTVLRRLLATGEALTLSELATVIADEMGPADDESRTRLTSQLYHVHVPKLRDADLVTVDDGHHVATTAAANRVEPYLSIALAAESK